MAKHSYDLLVIGAGAAGSAAASAAAATGKRVALIERNQIGGTCLNYGCDPTKTLIHIAAILNQSRHSAQFGLHIADAAADWPTVMSYVRTVINHIRGGTSEQAAANLGHKGIDVLWGEAAFLSPHEVYVSDTTISAGRIIIATGGQNVIPPIDGLHEAGFITNIEAVSLHTLPRRLASIGGGAIGMEFAQMFHRFGVAVTLLEKSDALLDKEDREMAEQLCSLLTRQGLRLETQAELKRVRRDGATKRLTIRCGERKQEELLVDEILLAIGRRPNYESLHLEKAGVHTGKKGIEVDTTLRTNIPHIWAAGDVTGGYQFTHVANEQGKLAAQNAFAEHPQPFDDHAIPWVTFTHPALAHVGKTEEQLKQQGVAYRTGRMYLKDVERAIAEDQTDGLVKLLIDEQGHLLGGHVLAPHAGDLLAPLVIAMKAGLPVNQLAETIMPYPTLVEGVRWAADKLK